MDDFFPFNKKFRFLGIPGPPYCGIGATIHIGREMLCLPYAGFLLGQQCSMNILRVMIGLPLLCQYSDAKDAIVYNFLSLMQHLIENTCQSQYKISSSNGLGFMML